MSFRYDLTSARSGIAWSCALAAAALLGTLASACMMPFVAIAVATAASMTRSHAIVTIGGIWAIDQVLGFGLLGYPPTAYAFAWGAALLVASLGAMLLARRLLSGRRALGLRLCLTFLAAFAAYEGGLFVFALLVGGNQTFTAPIILSIFGNDAIWFAGLVALHVVLTRAAPRLFGPSPSPRSA
jgi:hypothetical protein